MQTKINEIKKQIEEEGFLFEIGKFEDGHRYKVVFKGPSGDNQWLCRNYQEIHMAFLEALKTREKKLKRLDELNPIGPSDLEGRISHVCLIQILSNYNNNFECRFEFLDGPFLGKTVFKILSPAEMQRMGITLDTE